MLFPSTLIISADPIAAESQLAQMLAEIDHQQIKNDPDIFTVSQNTDYQVENIRQIKQFLSQNPYSHSSKAVIIFAADLLNTESQNTLLKDLEEPGANNYFFLITSKPGFILPTVSSRCTIIRLTSNLANADKILTFPSNTDKALSLSESLSADKLSVLPFLETQLRLYQQQLVIDPSPANSNYIKKIIKAIQMLGANIDPKNVLDFLFLS